MNVQSWQVADGVINTNISPPRSPIRALYEKLGSSRVNYAVKQVTFGGVFTGPTALQDELCGVIRQGTGVGQRLGNRISAKMLALSLEVKNLSTTTPVFSRVVVFYAKYPYDPSHLPAWTDIFNNLTACSTYKADRILEQNTILYDSGQIVLNGQTATNDSWHWTRDLHIELDFVVSYKSDLGTAEDVSTNNIWMLVWNDNPTVAVKAASEATLYYIE